VSVTSLRLRVAFAGHELEFDSDAPEVLESLAASFRHMRGTGRGAPFAVATIRRAGDRFRVVPPVGGPGNRATAADAIRWGRQQVIEAMMRARPDLLWMHGAAVARSGRAVILPGPRGRGKSTIATALCRRGWRFLSDDLVPLAPSDLRAFPFPRVPEFREDPGEEMPATWLRDAPKQAFDVSAHLETEPRGVVALVFPVAAREGDGCDLVPCAAADAVRAIAEGCWNFAELGLVAPETLSRLVSAVPAMTLTFGASGPAAERLTEWFDGGALDRRG
jgi:hypothetical protein